MSFCSSWCTSRYTTPPQLSWRRSHPWLLAKWTLAGRRGFTHEKQPPCNLVFTFTASDRSDLQSDLIIFETWIFNETFMRLWFDLLLGRTCSVPRQLASLQRRFQWRSGNLGPNKWKEELKHGPDFLPCYREKDSQGSSELATKLAHYQKMLSISEKKKKKNVSCLLMKK